MPRTDGALMPGGFRPIDGSGVTQPLYLPADDLVTHAVVLGMTGSGKTGLLMVLVEEAVRSSIPVVIIDIKGDLPNLLLTFPRLSEGLSETLKVLSPRWFVMRNVHRSPSLSLVKSRTTLTWMRGPMTRRDLGRLVGGSTAIIVTSDHGEAFGEHGMYRHGFEVWEESRCVAASWTWCRRSWT